MILVIRHTWDQGMAGLTKTTDYRKKWERIYFYLSIFPDIVYRNTSNTLLLSEIIKFFTFISALALKVKVLCLRLSAHMKSTAVRV
jgi:hypothetical protein